MSETYVVPYSTPNPEHLPGSDFRRHTKIRYQDFSACSVDPVRLTLCWQGTC